MRRPTGTISFDPMLPSMKTSVEDYTPSVKVIGDTTGLDFMISDLKAKVKTPRTSCEGLRAKTDHSPWSYHNTTPSFTITPTAVNHLAVGITDNCNINNKRHFSPLLQRQQQHHLHYNQQQHQRRTPMFTKGLHTMHACTNSDFKLLRFDEVGTCACMRACIRRPLHQQLRREQPQRQHHNSPLHPQQ
jgi:hypothetical protein